MCVVSAVSDYYTKRITIPYSPYIPPVHDMDNETKDMLRKAIEILDKIDKRLGDKECNDASKAVFLKELYDE